MKILNSRSWSTRFWQSYTVLTKCINKSATERLVSVLTWHAWIPPFSCNFWRVAVSQESQVNIAGWVTRKIADFSLPWMQVKRCSLMKMVTVQEGRQPAQVELIEWTGTCFFSFVEDTIYWICKGVRTHRNIIYIMFKLEHGTRGN